MIADNFASDGARSQFKRPACSLRRVEHVTMVLNVHGWFLGVKNSKNSFRVIWHWCLMTWWFHDLNSSLLSAKWMSESKSAPQITLEGSRTRKSGQRSLTSSDLSWPRLTCIGPDNLWNAEYYLVLHVHIHITSKNGDVCKLCATERIFRLTWPQLWRHRSNVRGVRILNFSGGT